MKKQIEKMNCLIAKLNWLPPLLARITVGVVFVESGWGKLHNLDHVVDYFASLGIPFANAQAPFVAGLEFVGGIFLCVGLLTRVISAPLIGVMIVAILTAKLEEISSLSDVFGFSEYLYIVLLGWLVVSGPGFLSLDRLLFGKKQNGLCG